MANYHPRFGRHALRMGLYAGALYAGGRKHEGTAIEIRYQSGAGFALGGQLGYEFSFTKKLALGLECSPRYAHASSKGFDLRDPDARTGYGLLYFPTVATVSVRL